MIRKQEEKKTYFFVDESGDPTFYNRYGKYIVGEQGCSKILILGFISTERPHEIREAVKKLQLEVSQDNYLKNIPSVKKSVVAFHATDDCPEVREKVYKLILGLPYKAEIVVARKIESLFIRRHLRNEDVFYDDLIAKLFSNQLHKSSENIIYFAKRGNRDRQAHLENAIKTAINSFEEKWKKKVDSKIMIYPQRPEGEACLQVIDYINWAIHRMFVTAEDRYFGYIKDKISLVFDVYDSTKYPKNYYNKKNVLEVKKISPL